MKSIKTGYDPRGRKVELFKTKKGFVVQKLDLGFNVEIETEEEAVKTWEQKVICSQNASFSTAAVVKVAPKDAPKKADEGTGYCLKCKAHSKINNPEIVTTDKGNRSIKGTCITCGCNMTKKLPKEVK